MFNQFRQFQYNSYRTARNYFIQNYNQLINLEKYVLEEVFNSVHQNLAEIIANYNEASYLYPFWQNYPPEERGRQPIGDQYPWLEVAEHTIGDKLPRLLECNFEISDVGLPTGSDLRLVISNYRISQITNDVTNSCWLFLEIKSVGPRDDQDHAVMSHNQISGSGRWEVFSDGISNDIITATGKRANHPFYCSLPPIYILSDGLIVPVVIIIVKPVYRMLSLEGNDDGGQPLSRISFASVPNGLLLHEQPHYLMNFPDLFFPGKDEMKKDPRKRRCRVSFEILSRIDSWRFREIDC